ncbi:hypothetical protein CB1_000813008 [Camelus ferus]|nr:hypothetical protein CB1_000813008 [Camelus ferus]
MEGVLYKWTNYLSGEFNSVSGARMEALKKRGTGAIARDDCPYIMLIVPLAHEPPPNGNTDFMPQCGHNETLRPKVEMQVGSLDGSFSVGGYYLTMILLKMPGKVAKGVYRWQSVKFKEGIDVGTLLKSTCNTFLKTLEECMQIANAAFTSELLYRTPPGSPQLAMLKSNKSVLMLHFRSFLFCITKLFSFSDIELLEDSGIPTEAFLASCYAVVPVLDKLGPTVFAPVKMDLVGNIKKVNQKYITNKEEFTTLQKIVLHEVEADVAQVRNSATEALLWLKSHYKTGILSKMREFGYTDNAYGKTLRQHHGWVVRGVFALALRAAPSYEDFVAALTIKEGDHQKAAFSVGMQRDLSLYLPAMEKQLAILDTLYEVHGLESDEVDVQGIGVTMPMWEVDDINSSALSVYGPGDHCSEEMSGVLLLEDSTGGVGLII